MRYQATLTALCLIFGLSLGFLSGVNRRVSHTFRATGAEDPFDALTQKALSKKTTTGKASTTFKTAENKVETKKEEAPAKLTTYTATKKRTAPKQAFPPAEKKAPAPAPAPVTEKVAAVPAQTVKAAPVKSVKASPAKVVAPEPKLASTPVAVPAQTEKAAPVKTIKASSAEIVAPEAKPVAVKVAAPAKTVTNVAVPPASENVLVEGIALGALPWLIIPAIAASAIGGIIKKPKPLSVPEPTIYRNIKGNVITKPVKTFDKPINEGAKIGISEFQSKKISPELEASRKNLQLSLTGFGVAAVGFVVSLGLNSVEAPSKPAVAPVPVVKKEAPIPVKNVNPTPAVDNKAKVAAEAKKVAVPAPVIKAAAPAVDNKAKEAVEAKAAEAKAAEAKAAEAKAAEAKAAEAKAAEAKAAEAKAAEAKAAEAKAAEAKAAEAKAAEAKAAEAKAAEAKAAEAKKAEAKKAAEAEKVAAPAPAVVKATVSTDASVDLDAIKKLYKKK